MLINRKNILHRFSKNLAWATKIDLATAWATSKHQGLRALQDRTTAPEVRTVVGLGDYLTDPDALKALACMGELRKFDGTHLFHPKVYIFGGAGKSVAWIGSANFTGGGFGKNEEILFEFSDTKAVQKWFNDLWERCARLSERDIDAYAKLRKSNPPLPQRRHMGLDDLKQLKQVTNPLEFLKMVDDWGSYVDALRKCDWWWRNEHPYSVLGEPCSWYETIRILNDMVKQDWNTLSDYDKNRLLGLTNDEPHWGLLGNMYRSALKTVFGPNQNKIQSVIRRIIDADDSSFPDVGIKAYKKLRDVEGVGPGIATRLLALGRPDRFVSLNKASENGLAKSFGLSPSTLGKSENYGRLLQEIYRKKWFCAQRPSDAHDDAIWRMRVALLDCFVYERNR